MNRRDFILRTLGVAVGACLARILPVGIARRLECSGPPDTGDEGVMVELGEWHEMDEATTLQIIKSGDWKSLEDFSVLVPESFSKKLHEEGNDEPTRECHYDCYLAVNGAATPNCLQRYDRVGVGGGFLVPPCLVSDVLACCEEDNDGQA